MELQMDGAAREGRSMDVEEESGGEGWRTRCGGREWRWWWWWLSRKVFFFGGGLTACLGRAGAAYLIITYLFKLYGQRSAHNKNSLVAAIIIIRIFAKMHE